MLGAPGDNYGRIMAAEALGHLGLVLGTPEEAVAQLEPPLAVVRREAIAEPGVTRFAVDLIEALVELGRSDEAIEILDWYEGNARRLERASALANCRRCRGLLASGDGELEAALVVYEEALAWHDRAEIPLDRGRTLLALGAAQRRVKRRREARATLEQALALFEKIGAALWAERARGELRRISGRAPTTGALTPAEERVAALVVQGKTNREVAAALFLSDRTVEGHLSRIFGKLGVRHRTELARALATLNHRGSRSQTRGTRPFRPIQSLPSLETGGQEGHVRTRRRSDDPQDLLHRRRPAALVFAVPAFGDAWGTDRNQETVRVSPDFVDRAAAVRQQELSSMLDARERSLAAKSEATTIVAPDPIRDNRFRLAPAGIPIPAATISSPREIDWLQIAIGFGAGALLAIGLSLAMRATRVRQPAH